MKNIVLFCLMLIASHLTLNGQGRNPFNYDLESFVARDGVIDNHKFVVWYHQDDNTWTPLDTLTIVNELSNKRYNNHFGVFSHIKRGYVSERPIVVDTVSYWRAKTGARFSTKECVMAALMVHRVGQQVVFTNTEEVVEEKQMIFWWFLPSVILFFFLASIVLSGGGLFIETQIREDGTKKRSLKHRNISDALFFALIWQIVIFFFLCLSLIFADRSLFPKQLLQMIFTLLCCFGTYIAHWLIDAAYMEKIRAEHETIMRIKGSKIE